MRLQEFGEELRTVISTIVPNKTPIHLVLDGHAEDRVDENAVSYSGFRIGPATLEVRTEKPDSTTKQSALFTHHYSFSPSRFTSKLLHFDLCLIET